MGPMCRKFYTARYPDSIADEEITAPRPRPRILGDFTIRQGISGDKRADFIIYSDARWGDSEGAVSSVRFERGASADPYSVADPPNHPPQRDYRIFQIADLRRRTPRPDFSIPVPNFPVGLWVGAPARLGSEIRIACPNPHRAFLRELVSRTSAAARHRRSMLVGKFRHLSIDNHSAAQGLTKGDPRNLIAPHFIAQFWIACEKLNIRVWIGRAPSGKNISDPRK